MFLQLAFLPFPGWLGRRRSLRAILHRARDGTTSSGVWRSFYGLAGLIATRPCGRFRLAGVAPPACIPVRPEGGLLVHIFLRAASFLRPILIRTSTLHAG